MRKLFLKIISRCYKNKSTAELYNIWKEKHTDKYPFFLHFQDMVDRAESRKMFVR